MSTNENELFNEVLLDLAIIIKRNADLINENNELKKRMEEKENDITGYGSKESINN